MQCVSRGLSAECVCVLQFNFVGRILGPRGLTAKQLEAETGCKIMVRGKGSMRDKKKVSRYTHAHRSCIGATVVKAILLDYTKNYMRIEEGVRIMRRSMMWCGPHLTRSAFPTPRAGAESFGQVFKHCPWPAIAWGLIPVSLPGLLSQSNARLSVACWVSIALGQWGSGRVCE